jgi:hypothetical protein
VSPGVPLLLKLVVAHLAGACLLQSRRMALDKQRPGTMVRHLVVHGGLLAVVALTEAGGARLWGALALLLAAHGLIDTWSSRWAPFGLGRLVADQGLHALTLLGVVWIARPGQWNQLLLTGGRALDEALKPNLRHPRSHSASVDSASRAQSDSTSARTRSYSATRSLERATSR